MSPVHRLSPALALALERAMFVHDAGITPGPVPKEATAYWQKKHLKIGFNHNDVWRQEHDHAFTMAKVLRLDVLEAIKDELDTAIAEGVPFAEFMQDIEPRMKKLGWWDKHHVVSKTGQRAVVDPPRRLKLVYETNVRVARAVGQWDRIQRTKKTRPYLLYQIGPSTKHRDQHVAWHGLLLPADDPFWTYAFPPNGFNCHCHTRSVSTREYKELVKNGITEGEPEAVLDDDGLPTGHVVERTIPVRTKAPVVPLVPYLRKKTGETVLVRAGIDPGFDRLPGEGRAAVRAEAKARLGPQSTSKKRKSA